MTTVEPPAESDLFDETIEVVDGEFDREFWVEHCVQFLGLSPQVAEDKETGWLVGWYDKQKSDTY